MLPFAVLPRGRRERYSILGAQAWARFVVRVVLLARPRVIGEIQLPPGQGALLLANHRSWLDPLLLIAYGRSNGLSKREILYIPIIGVMGHLAGAVFFDRRSKEQRAWARQEVARLVRGGHRLQVFPEGTRSKDGTLRKRVFLTLPRDAWSDGIPVVPCAVIHTERVLPVGRPAAYPFQEVTVVFGPTLWPKEHTSEEDFAIASWQAVKDLLRQQEGSSDDPDAPESLAGPEGAR